MTTHGRTQPRALSTMSINGLSCEVHMPVAQKSRFEGRQEVARGLSPRQLVSVYRVDDFPGCPESWSRSDPSKNLASFFFCAKVGHMVWFDFNGNGRHPHHVAALISAQGVNGIDGRHVTYPLELAQYKHNCPKHGQPFSGDRYCAACGYAWPPQNYIANTTCGGQFWRDGFRDEGQTREFVFTEEKERGVAANLIGEARTEAFGIALYVSKEPKPQPRYATRGGSLDFLGGGGYEESTLESLGPKTLGATRGGARRSMAKSVEVGAGALVTQEVIADDKPIDYWQPEPAALIRVYFCGPEQFQDILGTFDGSEPDGGTPTGGGFLGGVPKGTF